MFRPINPATVPGPPFLSQGLEVPAGGRMLFVSGQVGVGPNGPGADIGEQTTLAVANLQAVLAEAGMGVDNIAKMTVYLHRCVPDRRLHRRGGQRATENPARDHAPDRQGAGRPAAAG